MYGTDDPAVRKEMDEEVSAIEALPAVRQLLCCCRFPHHVLRKLASRRGSGVMPVVSAEAVES